ncbi:MAG: DNA repair protein RecN [Pseudomonadota bacterium]
MLRLLSIRDVVLVEALDLDFDAGLNVLTGETGAGKSILLDALGLALGARGGAGLVRQNASLASVTAEFDTDADHPACAVMDRLGFAGDGGPILLRRTITPEGRSRAFVNDEPASVGALRQIGEALVEVHGQHDDRGLMDAASHRGLLDAYGGLTERAETARALRETWRTAEAALEARRTALAEAERDADFLRYAVEEISRLAPEPGEEAALDDERRRLRAAVKISDELQHAAAAVLDQATGAEARIREAQRGLGRIGVEAGEPLSPAIQAVDQALDAAAEAGEALEAALSAFTIDPARLDTVEERLFALRALARKHNRAVEDLPGLAHSLGERLAAIDAGAGALAAAETETAQHHAAFFEHAEALHQRRLTAASALDQAVTAELAPLRMEAARFETVVSRLPKDETTTDGISQVSFRVTTNPGTEPGPIDRIASGGELSRFLLALKVCLSKAAGRAAASVSVIFDEIDRGVGGATADAVGTRLLDLARGAEGERQVLVVTHSPQVAAKGQAHWQIEKRHRARAGDADTAEAVTVVTRLGHDARIDELARMLAGDTITDAARQAARALLTV